MNNYLLYILIGFIIGFIIGLFFYSRVLDKAEIENNYNSDVKIKQKKGLFRNIIDRIK